jgi:translation initiation factor 3 subunit L
MKGSEPGAMEMVTKFVSYFYLNIRNAAVADIETMYTLTFNKISNDFFPTTPWPRYQEIEKYVNDDLFWLMYQV